MREQEIIRVSRPKDARQKYATPLLKGLGYTLKNFCSRAKTIQYPEQRREVSQRWRGLHQLLQDDEGRLKCVACGLCAAICPARAIELTPYEEEGGIRYPREFVLDELRCIFCGFCEEVCPKGAIRLTQVYDYVDFTRENCLFDIEKLLDPEQFWFKEKKSKFQRLLG